MTRITMPQAGQSMEEGTILAWRKREGETVTKGEILLEVETDKATIEVEAAESGTLRKILCPSGATVPVHTPIAILGRPDEEVSGEVAAALAELGPILGEGAVQAATAEAAVVGLHPATAIASGAPQSAVAVPATARVLVPGAWGVRASPAARKLARERGVDLGSLASGSGIAGRILFADVERLPGRVPAEGPVRRPLSGMRRAIARALSASKQTIPHFYMRLTVNAAPLLSFYRGEKELYPCTLNDVLIVACARTMLEFPAFRSRIEGDELVEFPGANIGLAVGMDEGLRVPVLVGVDAWTLRRTAEESRRIVAAAQSGKVEAMGQGQFTISNLGMFGIEEFSAIINPPEAAILAVGAIRETVIVSGEALRAGRVMTMTLSADHRIIDGLLAARFLAQLKGRLESPEALKTH